MTGAVEKDEEALADMASALEAMLTARPSREKRRSYERSSQKSMKQRSRKDSGEVRSAAINIRCTPLLKATLAKKAREMKMSQTELIEKAIAAYQGE